MTSETPSLPADLIPRQCCNTPLSGPHRQGCQFEPHPDRPVDYNGPAVVAPAAAEPAEPTPPVEPAAPAWPHQYLDFKGEHLEIRAPKSSAMAALQLILTSQFDQQQQNEAVGRFLRLHLSPVSLARVNERMIDPDETDFGDDYLPLILAMIERAGELAKEQADADAAPAAP